MRREEEEDATRTMRLLALAEIYDGGSRGNAVPIGRVELQTIRDRLLRSMLKGGRARQ